MVVLSVVENEPLSFYFPLVLLNVLVWRYSCLRYKNRLKCLLVQWINLNNNYASDATNYDIAK